MGNHRLRFLPSLRPEVQAGNGRTQEESKQEAQVWPVKDSKMRLTPAHHSRPRKFRTYLISALCVSAAILIAAAILFHLYWPFSESAVRKELGAAASATVRFERFEERRFPPGCVAEGVVFEKKGAPAPVVTVERLRISTDIIGL